MLDTAVLHQSREAWHPSSCSRPTFVGSNELMMRRYRYVTELPAVGRNTFSHLGNKSTISSIGMGQAVGPRRIAAKRSHCLQLAPWSKTIHQIKFIHANPVCNRINVLFCELCEELSKGTLNQRVMPCARYIRGLFNDKHTVRSLRQLPIAYILCQ